MEGTWPGHPVAWNDVRSKSGNLALALDPAPWHMPMGHYTPGRALQAAEQQLHLSLHLGPQQVTLHPEHPLPPGIFTMISGEKDPESQALCLPDKP